MDVVLDWNSLDFQIFTSFLFCFVFLNIVMLSIKLYNLLSEYILFIYLKNKAKQHTYLAYLDDMHFVAY